MAYTRRRRLRKNINPIFISLIIKLYSQTNNYPNARSTNFSSRSISTLFNTRELQTHLITIMHTVPVNFSHISNMEQILVTLYFNKFFYILTENFDLIFYQASTIILPSYYHSRNYTQIPTPSLHTENNFYSL